MRLVSLGLARQGHVPSRAALATNTTNKPAATYPHGAVFYRQVRKAGDIADEAFRVTRRRRRY